MVYPGRGVDRLKDSDRAEVARLMANGVPVGGDYTSGRPSTVTSILL